MKTNGVLWGILWSTTSPENSCSEMSKRWQAKSNAFEQPNLVVHSLNKTAGDAVRKKGCLILSVHHSQNGGISIDNQTTYEEYDFPD